MSFAESLHRAHKARRARIASRAVPQAEPAKAAPRALVHAAPLRPGQVVDSNYERAWAAVILGQTEGGRLRRKPTIEEIQRATAQHFGVGFDDLLAKSRASAVAGPRHVAMFLARELTAKGCREIGESFDRRDHSVVVHAVRRIRELLADDPELAESIDCIRSALKHR
jgi:chromosomal replication initiation ATPase DnaA